MSDTALASGPFPDTPEEPSAKTQRSLFTERGRQAIRAVGLIVVLKLHAFLALTIGALVVGLSSGIPLQKVTGSYEAGVGGVLGYVGVLIGLGAILGKLLADSGGADRVVDTILRGKPATLPWKMALIAAIIGIPMFFEIGLVLLIPVVMLAVHRMKGPALRLGIPALAGLSVLHGFVPPHPGPLAAIAILHANVGLTVALGLLIAMPCVVVAGPLFGMLSAKWVPIGAAGAALAVTGTTAEGHAPPVATGPHGEVISRAQDPDATSTPSFGITLVTILSPLVLMLIKAAADILVPPTASFRPLLDFIGDPVFALLAAVLLGMITFGTKVGFNAATLSRKIGASLTPIVSVLFIVGAWPVIGFLGLDVALVYWAFRANYLAAAAYEEVTVTPSVLRVRKVTHKGRVSEWSLNPVWTQIARETHEDFGVLNVFLVSRGRRLASCSSPVVIAV